MKTVVSFSGGKDSTAMLLWLLDRGEKVDDVLFFDTGWEFPEMYDHLAKVEEYIGFKINVVRPPESFTYTLLHHKRIIRRGPYAGKAMIGYGFPGFETRWCTGRKQAVLDKYFKQFKDTGVRDCIGYAADEIARISNVHPNKWHKYRFPLIEAGMTEKNALKYCYDRGFDWGGAYTRNKRLSCWCCPLQNIQALRNLYHHYPELWTQLKEWQKILIENNHAQKNRHGYIDFRGKTTVFEYEERFKREDKQGMLWE